MTPATEDHRALWLAARNLQTGNRPVSYVHDARYTGTATLGRASF